MFERFTDRSRQVIVSAQEEARRLCHDFIGTEHLLYGLAAEGDGGEPGVAAQVLAAGGIGSTEVNNKIIEMVGIKDTAPVGNAPFTPRTKKVLELSLRESLQLGHNYIGPEHILLGLIREGEGAGMQILVRLGATGEQLRKEVLDLLRSYIVAAAPRRISYTAAEIAVQIYESRDAGRSLIDTINRLAEEGVIILESQDV